MPLCSQTRRHPPGGIACRFTWGAIQRRRATAGTAVLLTTHSMEEADLLADRIAIMAHGRWARLAGTCLAGRRQGRRAALPLGQRQKSTAAC